MALVAGTIWEARASGASDNNGGGYVPGAGTDFSQQNAAQLTLTDLATTGVVTTLTSVTGGFTSSMVNNLIHIVSGTNFTAGFYQITAFTNANTVTLDRAPATGVGAGGTGSVGGALATLGALSAAMTQRQEAWITGAFTSTATITFVAGNGQPSASTPPTWIRGYGSVRGDSGHATLTLQTNTGLTGITTNAQQGFRVEQVDVDCGSLGTSTGISTTQSYGMVRNCKVSNFTTRGIFMTGAVAQVTACEVTGGTSAATCGIEVQGGASTIIACHIHDNACPGISNSVVNTGATIARNLVVNNTGASSDGIQIQDAGVIEHNTIHGNGRDGLRFTISNSLSPVRVRNNIFSSNAGWGVTGALTTAIPAVPENDGNAYYNNTSGTRTLWDSTTGVFGTNPYVNVRDKTLTNTPYVGPTSGSTANFGLNKDPVGGKLCRGTGTPSAWPGLTGTASFPDMGAVQSQDLSTPGILACP